MAKQARELAANGVISIVIRCVSWRLLAALAGMIVLLPACEESGSVVEARMDSAGKSLSGESAEPTVGKRLAVSHHFTLQLPSNEVDALQKKHLAECSRAGCSVLGTRIDLSNEGRISAWSSIRIAPDAYAAFVAILAAPPARIVAHAQSAEDKTIAMLDVEKRLEIKIALRDRLAAILGNPSQKNAAELAAIEKELAQVQGDIEASVAQRDYLRTITETVKVDIAYQGTTAEVSGFDLSPIHRAVGSSGRTIVASAAALVSFLAAAVPWLPLLALLAWFIRRAVRRWRMRKAAV
jgi:hypothetical protein